MSDVKNKTKAAPAAASDAARQIAEVKTTRQISAARFSPDGQVLAAVGFDSVVWRWQLTGNEFKPMPALEGHHGWATALAFHPVKPHLFTADSWGQLRCQTFAEEKPAPLWQLETAHDGWIRQIAISPDGAQLATCGHDRFVRVWSAADGQLLAEHQATEDLYAVAFAPKGDSIVFGDLRGNLEAWDTALKTPRQKFDATVMYKLDRIQDLAGLRALRFLDDGKTLVAGGMTPLNGATTQSIPTILRFDYESGKKLDSFTHGQAKEGFINDLVIHPGGYLMAVTSGVPGSGMIFFTRPGEKEPFFESTKLANCHALALHPDGKRFVVTSTNKDSNGNGRRLDKGGEYGNNSSPLNLFEIAG